MADKKLREDVLPDPGSEEGKVQSACIIMGANGRPFESESHAVAYISAHQDIDATRCRVLPSQTKEPGFTIFYLGTIKSKKELSDKGPGKLHWPTDRRVLDDNGEMTYHRVKFSAKSRPDDQDDVILAVNGEVLITARDREVILPGSFLEASDHGTYPRFEQLPNLPRKILGRVQAFPYTYLGAATKDEFMLAKAEGTRRTMHNVNLFGFGYSPEAMGMFDDKAK
uniref:Uncharacterized protein n=1 Tax=viral metagenome TaxID=1070528 RepID=A0A6M3IV18_9ZZZZ